MKIVDDALTGMENAMAYAMMAVFNGGHRYSEVRSGRLEERRDTVPPPPSEYDWFVADCEREYESQALRYRELEKKTDSLMFSGTALLWLSLAFSVNTDAPWYLLPIFLSICSKMMCHFAGRPRGRYYPRLAPVRGHADEDLAERMEEWCAGLHFNECSIGFKVGVYCAARRMVVLGLMSLLVISAFEMAM